MLLTLAPAPCEAHAVADIPDAVIRSRTTLRPGPRATPCWIFGGAHTGAGYGNVHRGGRWRAVHILVYEWLEGPVPPGKELDHLCRVRPCCNPAHVEPVPHRVNVRRGVSPAARNARKAVCKRGHDAWKVRADGTRECTICKYAQRRAFRIARDAGLPDAA